jgi:hypothetical protein
MAGDLELEIGSGNVFRDFDDPDAAVKAMTARAAVAIMRAMSDRGLDAWAASSLARASIGDIDRVLAADLAGFSLDTLLRWAERLGACPDLVFSEARSDAAA